MGTFNYSHEERLAKQTENYKTVESVTNKCHTQLCVYAKTYAAHSTGVSCF